MRISFGFCASIVCHCVAVGMGIYRICKCFFFDMVGISNCRACGAFGSGDSDVEEEIYLHRMMRSAQCRRCLENRAAKAGYRACDGSGNIRWSDRTVLPLGAFDLLDLFGTDT